MSYKLTSREVFKATVNNKEYIFTCYTQGTSYGFRHICTQGFNNTTDCKYIRKNILNKACYYNRTWECFRYETVLRGAIEKLAESREIKDKLKAILIDKKEQQLHQETEQFLKDFEKTYNSLSDKNKEILKNSPMIETEEQAQGVLGIMKMMSAFEKLGV